MTDQLDARAPCIHSLDLSLPLTIRKGCQGSDQGLDK